jgi:hypothetical protein
VGVERERVRGKGGEREGGEVDIGKERKGGRGRGI